MVAAAMLGAHAMPLYPETPAAELAKFIPPSVRIAIVEDQEQADKLLEVRALQGSPEIIIYDDPRGVSSYPAADLFSYEAVLAEGKGRLKKSPDLAGALWSGPAPANGPYCSIPPGRRASPRACRSSTVI